MGRNKVYPTNYKYYKSRKTERALDNESKNVIRGMYIFYICIFIIGALV